ncbi:hypothetical protein [Streptomyces sp. AC627_RSS907]|uniref:hypothetical protein n=1 Tax=Streptomyces sp. AC627_RSS907 TaxID=2823684 RepID=UPI001C22F46A|nr:hypothetical protein [Streptomyces sp. AC627_RSS907]
MKSWRSRVAAAVAVGVAAVTIPLTAGSASAAATDPDGFRLVGGWVKYQSCMNDGQDGLGSYWGEYQCRYVPDAEGGWWALWVR